MCRNVFMKNQRLKADLRKADLSVGAFSTFYTYYVTLVTCLSVTEEHKTTIVSKPFSFSSSESISHYKILTFG